jgi:NADP-dependent 3-hydroxy acid dehydrogenase YdfG
VALAERGVTVGLVGRRRSTLERVQRRLAGSNHLVDVVDLTSDAEVRRLVQSFRSRFGRLDILVHSNGSYASGELASAKPAAFDRLWAANVRGPFVLTQLALPALRETTGQIVFVNSTVGLESRPGVGHFAATQHALRALADVFRTELNPEGIRVLSIYPGRTATSRQRRIYRGEDRTYEPERLLQPEEIATIVVESLALPRTAEVVDVHIRPLQKP